MELRNAELEAAIVRDPDDLASYAVYGDWLAEQGDPRGELIAVQLAAESGGPALRLAATGVFARHRAYFLGTLADQIETGAFSWRAGFIHKARLSHELLLFVDGARVDVSLAQIAEQLLAHPSARFLAELTIGTIDRDGWGRPRGGAKDVIDKLAAAAPIALRRLHLGDSGPGPTVNLGSLGHLWPAVPGLHELVLEGNYTLGALVLPGLRRIDLRPTVLRRRSARELLEASWPLLESFRIALRPYPDVQRELTVFVQRPDLTRTHLGLIGYPACAALLEALAESEMLGRLRELDVTRGELTDRGLRPIFAHPTAFAHLALDVTGTQLSRGGFERLQRIVPGAVRRGVG